MRKMTRYTASLVALLGATLLAGCAHSPPSDPWDPLEPVNRQVYKFNHVADHYVLRPIAKGYNKITPQPVQNSVSHFFANLDEPVTMANSLLQLKWGKFNTSLGRFMINSSVGIGGLFDFATDLGVAHPDEDLGQTLGFWGVGPGAYLVLPLLGPSDGRDLIGRVSDQFGDPLVYVARSNAIHYGRYYTGYQLRALQLINLRASLLGFDQTLEQQFDPYAFVRGYYLQNRLNAVYDGNVPADRKTSDQMPADDNASFNAGSP